MINYRVSDLHALLAKLRAEGCNVLDKTEESAHGKFGWVMDPEDNKVELWQPPRASEAVTMSMRYPSHAPGRVT